MNLGKATGQGVNRKRCRTWAMAGRGVNRQLPAPGGDAGQGRTHYIYRWFGALRDRMRGVRSYPVGDWQRVLTKT